jgi:predicted MFS family arabinose efflux permease
MLNVLSWRNVVVLNVVPGVIAAGLVMLWLGRLSWGAKGERSGARRVVERGEAEPGEAMRAPRRNDAGALAALRLLLANRTVLMLSLGSAMRAMTASTLLTFLPVFLSGELGYSPPWVGGAMFTLQAAGFAAAPVTGHLSDRMGRRRIIVTSMGVSAVVLAFMAVAGRSPAFVFFVAFLGFFLFAVRAVLQAWLLDATPRHMGGTSIGIMFGSQALGAAIGPFAGGVLADHYGLIATFYFLAVTIVIANMFIFFTPTAEPGKQRQPATA